MKITIEINDELINEILKEKVEDKEEIYHIEKIVLSTREDAETVLEQLDHILDNYGVIRVADLYDLAGVRTSYKDGVRTSYKDNFYGWFDIKDAEIDRVRQGYMIKMPKVTKID